MNKFLAVVFVFLILDLGLSSANEDESAVAAEEVSPRNARAVKELMDLEKQTAGTLAKINGKEASIISLLKEKQKESDPAKVSEIIKLLQVEHTEMKQLIKDYDRQLNVLKYRFPERGSSFERKYKRFSSKSLDQMEQAVGIEKHLNDSRNNVKRVYGVQKESEQKKNEDLEIKKKNSIIDPSVISK